MSVETLPKKSGTPKLHARAVVCPPLSGRHFEGRTIDQLYDNSLPVWDWTTYRCGLFIDPATRTLRQRSRGPHPYDQYGRPDTSVLQARTFHAFPAENGTIQWRGHIRTISKGTSAFFRMAGPDWPNNGDPPQQFDMYTAYLWRFTPRTNGYLWKSEYAYLDGAPTWNPITGGPDEFTADAYIDPPPEWFEPILELSNKGKLWLTINRVGDVWDHRTVWSTRPYDSQAAVQTPVADVVPGEPPDGVEVGYNATCGITWKLYHLMVYLDDYTWDNPYWDPDYPGDISMATFGVYPVIHTIIGFVGVSSGQIWQAPSGQYAHLVISSGPGFGVYCGQILQMCEGLTPNGRGASIGTWQNAFRYFGPESPLSSYWGEIFGDPDQASYPRGLMGSMGGQLF